MMTDGLPNLMIAGLIALLLVGHGALAAMIMLVAALGLPLSPGDSRFRRVLRYLAGPTTCLGVGGLYLLCVAISADNDRVLRWLAGLSPAAILAAVVATIVVHRRVARALDPRLKA
jgi:hypothetical protein